MYDEFYGFSEAPFNLTPDPKFLFLPNGHFEVLSSMISGIKERRGTAVISGEVGTGKTTLIYALLKELGNKNKIAFIFYTNVSFRDLLKNILRGLDIPVFENRLTTLLSQFHQYLEERIARDEEGMVIYRSPREDRAKWEAPLKGIEEIWLQDMGKKGLSARKVYAEFNRICGEVVR